MMNGGKKKSVYLTTHCRPTDKVHGVQRLDIVGPGLLGHRQGLGARQLRCRLLGLPTWPGPRVGQAGLPAALLGRLQRATRAR